MARTDLYGIPVNTIILSGGQRWSLALLPSPVERREASVPPIGEDTLESEVTRGLVADVLEMANKGVLIRID